MSKKLIVIIVVLGCLVGAGTIYRVFFLWTVRVPTGSMMNTILPGDRLMAHRSFGDIGRNSIVIFQYPGDSNNYVARVVGLPGETIQIRGRSISINATELAEQQIQVTPEDDSRGLDKLEEVSSEGTGPYKVFYTSTPGDSSTEPPLEDTIGTASPFRIGEGQYFLLGDNRDNSYDSRYRGAVPRESIWGTVSLVYWSSFSDKATQVEHVRSDRLFTRIR